MQRGMSIVRCWLSLSAGLALLLTGCSMLQHLAAYSEAHSTAHSAPRSEILTDPNDARGAAVNWVHLVDNAKYKEAYELEAQDVRESRTKEEFGRFMETRRTPFGRARSRVGMGTARFRKVAGRPEGEYVSVLFKTSFEHKGSAAERVILLKQPDGWRIIDYQIY